MKYILSVLLLVSSMLIAEETCYTVQVFSANYSQKNLELLQQESYDNTCKVMHIKKTLTVRCGCFNKYKEATTLLKTLKPKHKDAYVTKTYKYRFDTNTTKTQNIQKEVVENSVKEKKRVPLVTSTPKIEKEEKIAKQAALLTKTNATPQKNNIKQPNKEISSLLHEEMQKEEKKSVKKEKKKKKKKKRKKNKVKIQKKKPAHYAYQRYLRKLQNTQGTGTWNYKYRFGAQISYDFAYVSEEQDGYYDHDLRRFRVYNKGSFFHDKLFYELEYSFTGPNNYKDIYIGYQNELKPLALDYRFKAGNIKVPFSLEGYTTSKNITFMERALTDAYADRRKVGGEVLLRKKIDNNHLNIFFDVFSNSIDERRDTDIDHPGYSTRAVYAYKAKKYKIFSLGGAYMYQNYNGDSIKYNQSAESDLIYNKYVSVKIRNVESVEKSNVESAIVYDKLSLQGEYSTTNVQTDINDYNFNGYYAQASYFLLGKGRRYKTETSTFGKINPNNDTALEVAFRYSYINLNDKDEHGGEQTDYNFGVNWYITREFKWMFNYIMAYPNDTDDYDGLLQIWQMRLLFAF